MIRLKYETEFYYYPLVKIVKRLFTKPIKKQRKHWNLNLPNQEKYFISIHQLK